MKHKISLVFGTRPEAIKLGPVYLALLGNQDFVCTVCVTAQHRQMLDQVLEVFGIVTDSDLNLMQENQSLASYTARAVQGLDAYFQREAPDIVLAQGDTTTVFCAALAAFYRRIPFGHVEAGLRTGNICSPWPEEANRVLTSRIATLHFAPTESARQNLVREGIDPSKIFVTGNTVIDALHVAIEKIRRNPPRIPGLTNGKLGGDPGRRLVLITGHRRESFGEGFEEICKSIAALADQFPDTVFVYPVHLNPNVRQPVFRILANRENVFLTDPLDYLSFISLMDRSTLILSDSGGIQEEAPSLGKPVLVMRDNTERPEAIDIGVAKLVGTNKANILREATAFLRSDSSLKQTSVRENPFGDGNAASRIVDACKQYLSLQKREELK